MNSIGNLGDVSMENISFVEDIQMMMFGLGDSPTPLQSTAAIVEKIVLQQLLLMIGQAEEIADKRGADGIYPQDILFLMRKDIPKLNRIVSYISLKDVKRNFSNILSADGVPTNLEEFSDNKGGIFETKSKKQVICTMFLESLGIELMPIDDPARHERLFEMDQRLQNMSLKSFYEHQKSRRMAFANAQSGVVRFLEWLQQNSPESSVLKLKSFTVDLLLFLAKETVAQLIDLALVLRRDAEVCPTDPLSRAAAPPLCDPYPPPPNRLVEGPPPITADEVREVLRRFYSPQLNPWSPFTCNLDPTIFNKLIVS